jgi:hypothetical protein
MARALQLSDKLLQHLQERPPQSLTLRDYPLVVAAWEQVAGIVVGSISQGCEQACTVATLLCFRGTSQRFLEAGNIKSKRRISAPVQRPGAYAQEAVGVR